MTGGPALDARRRERHGAAFVALLAVALAGTWLLSTGLAGWWRTPAQLIATELTHDPRTPVLVPTELPDGYTFRGIGRTLTDTDGDRNVATWVYGPRRGGPDVPVVEICVVRRDSGASVRGSCVPIGTDEIIYETGRRLRVAIVSLGRGDRDDLEQRWAGTELTHRWTDPRWVHQR